MRRGRWEPLQELEAMQNELRRAFGQMTGLGQSGEAETGTWLPPLDVSETEADILLSLDLPGIRREGIEVEVDEGTLTVSGSRERVAEEGRRFYRVERRFGAFSRSVPLPPGIEEERIEADYRDGVLEVRVPKPTQAQPRRIQIGGEPAQETSGEPPPAA